MGQHFQPYTLTTRDGIYYVKLEGTTKRVSLKTRNPAEAKRLARELWEKSCAGIGPVTLAQALAPYYTDDCPHLARQLAEGKTVGVRYQKEARRILERFVLTDRIAGIMLADLKRKDLLDFQGRIIAKHGMSRTSQEIMARMKTCLKELYFREELDRDVTAGVGTIRHEKQERDAFTLEELQTLFRDRPGNFLTELAYDVFVFAAHTGMRRGEILALHWEDVDLVQNIVHVRKALKDAGQGGYIGKPKWNKLRDTPLLPQAREAILRQPQRGPLVFCHPDGEALGINWWRWNFIQALGAAGIGRKGLVAHSFRHTLNSLWRTSGASDLVIRAALGWTTERVQDGYSHVSLEDLRKLPEV